MAAQVFQVNVVGNIHLFNLFLPLVQQGRAKKVVAVSSGHAALDLINTYEIDNAALYAASKAALNIVVAKFHAQYKKEGILFLSISPGIVDVGHGADGMLNVIFLCPFPQRKKKETFFFFLDHAQLTTRHGLPQHDNSHPRTDAEHDGDAGQVGGVRAAPAGGRRQARTRHPAGGRHPPDPGGLGEGQPR